MAVIEWVGQSARDSDNAVADPTRLLNVYRERAGNGVPWLKSVLGMDPVTTLAGVFITAMGNVGGKLYVVCGGRLFRVSANGAAADLGAVDHGPATISGNNGYVVVQAGSRLFVYDTQGGTLTEPVTGAFAAIGSCEFFDNYTIATQAGGRMFGWSKLADPTDWPGLNFSTADGRDDNLLRAMALHGQLCLFKERSHELWYNTGSAGAEALARVAGGVRDVGLKSRDLICRFTGGAFMVGSDNRAHMVVPGGLQPVSTPAVETAIKLQQPTACVAYADEGHDFVCIVFRDGPAWCYDIATGEWHERAFGSEMGPWPVSSSAVLGSEWVVGGNTGIVSAMRRVNNDGSEPLVREATSGTLYMDGARSILRELELFPRQGFDAGEVMLALSRDGGSTWTPWKVKALPPVGRFEQRVIWRGLGQARRINAKVRWTSPVDVCISAQARIAL